MGKGAIAETDTFEGYSLKLHIAVVIMSAGRWPFS